MQNIIFKRKNFYDFKNKNFIANIIPDELIKSSKIENNFRIFEISTLDNYKDKSIFFISYKKITPTLINKFKNISLSIHIITDSLDFIKSTKSKSFTYTENLLSTYSNIINNLLIHPDDKLFKDKFFKKNNSYISLKAKIHHSSKIGNNCTIGRGVILGKNCIIKDNVIIKNSILENNVIIHENSVIGSTGFGFDLTETSNSRYQPQIGIVYIASNTSIGSCCTIDRGKINFTLLGKSCMLDNQVHIAHNVILGDNVVIAGQSGVAGSSTLGNNVIMGGQSGISGHLKIGNNVMIGAKSAVIKNLNDNSVVAGYPAIDIKKWKKIIINQRNF